MARFLRYIDAWSDEPEISAALARADVQHLCWMYEAYATPCPADGVKKVNVSFTSGDSADPTDVLEIAIVEEHFDLASFQELPDAGQTAYYAERLHEALLRCARHYGWSPEPFVAAHTRIREAGYRFAFWWKKPVLSPDRRVRVQAFVEAGRTTHIWLVFSGRDSRELSRVLLTDVTTGAGVVQHVLGRITWSGPETVTVTMANGRDYWTVTREGEVQFHYPRADRDDPAGMFDLGKMYYEGTYVLPHPERGLELIRAAAAKGYKHAINYLRRLGSVAPPHPPELQPREPQV